MNTLYTRMLYGSEVLFQIYMANQVDIPYVRVLYDKVDADAVYHTQYALTMSPLAIRGPT